MRVEHLYKVSAPRADMTFHPSRFWRSADWESSTTRPREGYIEESVLYAGDFDEINIHLFPRVHTIRVRAVDADAASLRDLGFACSPGRTAWIFVPRSRRVEVESFRPTIYAFAADGFTRVRKGEYVSWEPRRALSCEALALRDAVVRWNVEPCYVERLDAVRDALARAAIYFDEQT